MAVVLLPLVIIGSWPFALLATALAYIGGFELVQAYASQEPSEEGAWLKYVFPLALSLLVFLGWLNPSLLLRNPPMHHGFSFIDGDYALSENEPSIFLAFVMQYVGLGLGALVSLRYVDYAGFTLFSQSPGLYLFAFVLVVTFFPIWVHIL